LAYLRHIAVKVAGSLPSPLEITISWDKHSAEETLKKSLKFPDV